MVNVLKGFHAIYNNKLIFSGSYDKGVVEVTNAFAVPHNESEDEVI